MIALDTNLLVYAHREDSPWHKAAFACLLKLAEHRAPWTIPWPCIHEFLAIVTHPGIFNPPTPLEMTLDQVEAWLESPSLVLISESVDYWSILQTILKNGRVTGPLVHDARIVALCLHHGISELWTADRDFGRFPGLSIRNPLVG